MYNSVNFQFFSPRFDRDKGLFPAREMHAGIIYKKNHDFVGETKFS